MHLQFFFFFQIRVVNAFRSSLYETRHYKRSMNSVHSIHNFLPTMHYEHDYDDDEILHEQNEDEATPSLNPASHKFTAAVELVTAQQNDKIDLVNPEV